MKQRGQRSGWRISRKRSGSATGFIRTAKGVGLEKFLGPEGSALLGLVLDLILHRRETADGRKTAHGRFGLRGAAFGLVLRPEIPASPTEGQDQQDPPNPGRAARLLDGCGRFHRGSTVGSALGGHGRSGDLRGLGVQGRIGLGSGLLDSLRIGVGDRVMFGHAGVGGRLGIEDGFGSLGCLDGVIAAASRQDEQGASQEDQ